MSVELDILRNLSELAGPSGYEKDVLVAWHNEIGRYVDEFYYTRSGNAVGVKKGQGTARKKIMLAAHADEIGFIITYIDDNGFLYFDAIGGIDVNMLPGRRVAIKGIDGRIIPGIIGIKPIHLQEDNKTALSIGDLWIDINVTGKDDARKAVAIGNVAVLCSTLQIIGSRISGKAMDNRSSLFVLLSVAQMLSGVETENDVYFVATVQEELRARGAQTAAFAINPDVCIVLDVTNATDYPAAVPSKDGDIRLGKGVVITLGPGMDGMIAEKLLGIAENLGIEYQTEAVARPFGTDVNTVQVSRDGIPTGLVSIPCRYMHSSVEVIDAEDLNGCSALIYGFVKNL